MSEPEEKTPVRAPKWLEKVVAGDETAVNELVEDFYQQLVRVARRKLTGMPPQIADEEGAVISALRSFFSAVQNGQFSQFNSENDLWKILATITARKAVRQLRVHWKQSGEAGRVSRDVETCQLVSRFSSPVDEAIIIEECDRSLAQLKDPVLKQIAMMRLEGFETNDIAERLSIHVRSVQRKLKLIEAKWLESD